MTTTCKQPYTFVPVVTASTNTHPLTFHDGLNNKDKLSGAILCTLTVQTPMIVGHFQYYAKEIGIPSNKIRKKIPRRGKTEFKIIDEPAEHVILPEGWEGCGYPQQDKESTDKTNHIVHKDKSILEPLFLNGDTNSPVLISGTTLKGMLRQTLGAISNAPMERVKEDQFSYRPGLVHATERKKIKYKLFEALAKDDLDKKGEFNIEITDQDYQGGQYNFTLDADMVDRYWETTNTYKDKEIPKRRLRLGDNDPFTIKKDDIIFIEFNTENNKILSFGNHEQYRWIYADTTTRIQKGTTGKHQPRPETYPHTDEKVDQDTAQLTAARSLFGYVDGGTEGKDGNLNLGIGKKDYSRLAGRISINTAVELISNESTLEERFIQHEGKFNIPLRILSTPKASAVECYIDQSKTPEQGIFNTYGDFPGFEESGNLLAGRKFYYRWHSSLKDFCLSPDNVNNDYKDCIALAGNQSSIARYVSKPETQFKFTVRFKDLSEAELGAILCALSPASIATDNKEYWQQLGHARPLGLGGISIEIDKVRVMNNDLTQTDKTDQKTSLIKQFKDSRLCNQDSLKQWLEICVPGTAKQYMSPRQHGDNRLAHIRKARGVT